MTNQEIKELLEIFRQSGVAEMEVQRGDNRLRLTRAGTAQDVTVAAPATAPVAASSIASTAAQTTAREPIPVSTSSASHHSIVKSPIVGTFYDAGSPGAEPFVKVGDSVVVGQVLCIIESMKLMNEIESEVAGTIAEKLCESGHSVEYGQALFAIQPR